MTLHIELEPLLALAAGIGVLLLPKFFRYIVGIYLITMGLLAIIR